MSEKVVEASFAVSHIIPKNMKPFSDGDYVKECLNTAVHSIICPEKLTAINNISLSRKTETRRIEVLAEDAKLTLKDRARRFESYSLAMDESTDVKDSAQLAIFILASLKGTATGADMFAATSKIIESLELSFANLDGVATDGCPSMKGKLNGLVALINKHKASKGLVPVISYHFIKKIFAQNR